MQTMHTVFVSSTFVDLTEHRSAVQNAIRRLGAVDISMENFGAREERPKEDCLRIISEESDAFVGIYAHRYGFIPPGDRKSIAEAEYDCAGQGKLPRFIYLVNEDLPWPPKLVDAGSPAEKLNQFKGRLRLSHICMSFSTKDDLAASVAADLGNYLQRRYLVRVEKTGAIEGMGRPVGSWSAEDWNKYRDGKYGSNRRLFLVHSLAPSRRPGQKSDVFIYLTPP